MAQGLLIIELSHDLHDVLIYQADDAERSYGADYALKWFNFSYYYICKHVTKWIYSV